MECDNPIHDLDADVAADLAVPGRPAHFRGTQLQLAVLTAHWAGRGLPAIPCEGCGTPVAVAHAYDGRHMSCGPEAIR
jgi:hypothetical protein